MARRNEEPPVWRHFEEKFLIRWLYKQGHSWKMTMGEKAVAELIKELETCLRKMYPHSKRSAADILPKIADLRDDFQMYVDFISTPGVRFDDKRPMIYSWDAYLTSVGGLEPRRLRRFRLYGMEQWTRQKFLFDEGYLAVQDLDVVARYLQPGEG